MVAHLGMATAKRAKNRPKPQDAVGSAERHPVSCSTSVAPAGRLPVSPRSGAAYPAAMSRLPPFLTPRRARQFQLASLRWRRRAVFVLGGLLVGAAAVLLAVAADRISRAFQAGLAYRPLLPLLATPAGFVIVSVLARRFFPNSGGSGIPQVIAARELASQAGRDRLVSLRLAAGKSVLLLLGLLCGASIGREGPTVQVGASIMSAVGRLSPRRQSGLILAGAAAGVAAAVNTPLAGIVFGIEEMSRSFEARTSGIVIGTVIAAGLTSLSIQGDYTYFGMTHATLHGTEGWIALPAVGVIGGLVGGLFSRILVLFGSGVPGAAGRLIRAHPALFAGACGVIVALCGLASHGDAFGTGYAQARALVQGGIAAPPPSFGMLKFLATLASSVSGIPGGIFAPSLAVGAGIGADMAWLLPGAPAQVLVVLGMVAYFAGVVQAPITAFVIVEEMTNNHALVVPLMLASVIGYATSRLVCPEGVYHALAHHFVAAAVTPQPVEEPTPTLIA
jgi:H+/Cl- antiporter ClcA